MLIVTSEAGNGRACVKRTTNSWLLFMGVLVFVTININSHRSSPTPPPPPPPPLSRLTPLPTIATSPSKDLEMERLENPNRNSDEYLHIVAKGKRTKRRRAAQLPAPSPTSSAEFSGSTTEEEEDMANCLILLAQGRASDTTVMLKLEPEGVNGSDGGEKRRIAAEAVIADGKSSFYVYECKTCTKRFPSFQSLGGHRASHKRPKMAVMETATPPPLVAAEEAEEDKLAKTSIASILNTNTGIGGAAANKRRLHQCSICGSEFSSGQALGGHMRRHRSMTVAESQQRQEEKMSLFSFDLNLPAPSGDDDGQYFLEPPSAAAAAFPFVGNRPFLFPAALVDCHH